jgi:hypothetical protein
MKAQYFGNEGVSFSDLDSKSIIGVQFKDSRCHVVKVQAGHWILSGVSSNHGYASKIKGETIKELLDGIHDKKKVLLFETFRELGEWLIQNL